MNSFPQPGAVLTLVRDEPDPRPLPVVRLTDRSSCLECADVQAIAALRIRAAVAR